MASGSSGMDLSHIPLSKPPPGEVTNFVNPESISWAGRLSIYLTLPIMIIAFCLRLYVRIRKHQLRIDDLFLVIGAAASTSFSGVLFRIFAHDELGRHAWNIPVSAIHPWFIQYSLTAGCLYNVSAMFTKISILTLYFYIFNTSRRARFFIWIGIVTIAVSYLALTASLLFYLVPHEGDGDWGSPANRQRAGGPARIIDFVQGVFSAVTDYYVLSIPIFEVTRLQSPLRRKIGITCIFLTGLISCGASTAGVVFRHRALVFTVEDNRYLSIKFEALTVAELNIGILCACIPVFSVLFKTAVQRTESGFIHLRERLSPHGSGKGDITDAEGKRYPMISAKVPSGTLNLLKSIFRRAGRTQSLGTEAVTDVPVTDFQELQSMDYDYHAHIRQSSPHTASTKSLIRPKSQV
ncbi:hypothetical protein F4802DRAFT_587864 [Xylaria palmicola]|nr:hypothetical protein F4802DRAFT_587864 [Xylaria palmicola]